MQILSAVIMQAETPTELLLELVDKLYEKLKGLLNTRYDWSLCKNVVYLQEAAGGSSGPEDEQQNFIVFVAHQVLAISSYLLDPPRFKRKLCLQVQEQPEVNSSAAALSNQVKVDDLLSSPELIDDTSYTNSLELKHKVWLSILPIVKSSLLFDLHSFDKQ